jgi:monothiol glutaredoxin
MSESHATNSTIFDVIRQHIADHDVVLYMKGTAETPMCGFSSLVVQVLNLYGLSFKGVNVLEDPELRQGIKDFTQWPTIPQLYVKGEFIGGADIVREMHKSGELAALFKEKQLIA